MLSSWSGLVFLGLTALTMSAAGAAETMPKFDLEPTCRGATRQEAMVPNQTDRAAREICFRKENEARSHLRQNWSSFPAEHRTSCVRTTSVGGIPSYVQLQTCLETRQNARTISGEGSDMELGIRATTTGQGRSR